MNYKEKKVLRLKKTTKRQHSTFNCPACQERRWLEFLGWNEEEEELKSEPALVFFCKNCSEFFICNYEGFVFWRNLGSLSISSRNSNKNFDSMALFLVGVE
jgi:hypothetical protein